MKGVVYLLCNAETNAYKIGVTTGKIEKRIHQLQTGNDCEIHLVAFHESNNPFTIEKMLHRKFFGKNKINEWYNLEGDDIFKFEKICENFENIISSLNDNPFYRKHLK